jgi:hypothetical protein
VESIVKPQSDLHRACLKALVPITERLVIKVKGEEGDGQAVEVSSRLFHRYFQQLLSILERALSADVG